MKKTTIIGINAVILAILLTIMIYPLKPQTSLKREVTLKWFAIYKNYSLYIDDNREFTSPIEIKTQTNSYKISLEPGTYFWKIKAGKISSPVRKLTLPSGVSIKVKNTTLENDGNVDLDISLQSVTGAAVIDLPYKEKIQLKNKNYNITAKQK